MFGYIKKPTTIKQLHELADQLRSEGVIDACFVSDKERTSVCGMAGDCIGLILNTVGGIVDDNVGLKTIITIEMVGKDLLDLDVIPRTYGKTNRKKEETKVRKKAVKKSTKKSTKKK